MKCIYILINYTYLTTSIWNKIKQNSVQKNIYNNINVF